MNTFKIKNNKNTYSVDQAKKAILDIIKLETRPIKDFVLLRKIISSPNKNANGYLPNDIFYEALEKLVESGEIKKLSKSESYVMGYENAPVDQSITYTGNIRLNSSGSGFVDVIENGNKKTFYIFRTNINGALDGDNVEINPMIKPVSKNNTYDAVVNKVISRGKDFFVCIYELDKQTNKFKVIPDNEKMYYEIILDDTTGIVDGQKILVKIKSYENNKAYGTISRIIGHKSDVGADVLSIVLDKGVEPDFTEETLEYSRSLKLNIDEHQRQIRKDLTNLPIVTIDPATSKDFDDAIYVKKISDKCFKLIVCIADVAHYVQPESLLDEVALKRGCSIYLVDRVIPMLPHILSDDICSLNYDVERLTMTSEMTIDDEGNISNIQVYPSIIKSHRRFAYDEVNQYFNKQSDLPNDTEEVKDMLFDARQLHHILSKAKAKRGYISFDVPEPIIKLDEQGFPISIEKRKSGEAQEMIEDFMLAANEAVTKFAHKNNVPFIYRVHEKPNEDKIKTLLIETKKLNFKITTDLKNIQPSDISKWFKDNEKNPNMDLINTLMLRCMAKAEYSVNNVGHFGLALEDYTHFTSPIRRYPDLMVGRLFWMYIFEREKYTDEQRNHFVNLLDEYCKLSSKNEVIAIDCERDVNSMKFAEYMTRHIGEEFDGYVSSVTSFGCFVELPNTIEGLIKLADLSKADFFTYMENTNELIGRNTGLVFRLGTKVRVKVIQASKELRKINFELVRHLGNR